MAKPRTATALLEARGAFAKNPQRKRQDPKVSNPFPSVAPADLTPSQVHRWHDVVKMVPDGVLTGADQLAVRVCAVLFDEMYTHRGDMPTAKIAQLRGIMGELGLSPSARAKLATKPQDDDEDF